MPRERGNFDEPYYPQNGTLADSMQEIDNRIRLLREERALTPAALRAHALPKGRSFKDYFGYINPSGVDSSLYSSIPYRKKEKKLVTVEHVPGVGDIIAIPGSRGFYKGSSYESPETSVIPSLVLKAEKEELARIAAQRKAEYRERLRIAELKEELRKTLMRMTELEKGPGKRPRPTDDGEYRLLTLRLVDLRYALQMSADDGDVPMAGEPKRPRLN